MLINTEAILQNHPQSIKTAAGLFMVNQRNGGYADNDGAWTVELLPDLYWSAGGVLRARDRGRWIGVFPTVAAAETAIETAEPATPDDHMII